MEPEVVEFYVDPGCPWTWLASRWLAEVATQRDIEVRWRPFSLALLNAGRPTPPQFDTPAMRERVAAGAGALRVLTALGEAGDHQSAGRFYEEFGRRFHDGDEPDRDPVHAAAESAGVDAGVADGDRDALDVVIAGRLDEALALAGPDVGSPVLRIGDADRGFHGPIVSPRVAGADAVALFDALVVLQASNAFFEIKRGRSAGPALGAIR
jgi:hypothetical protein